MPACTPPDLLQIDLVDQRLQVRAIEHLERRDATQVRRHQLGEPALQRLERRVASGERERHHGDRRDGAGNARQLSLLRDRLLGARFVLASREHGEPRVDLFLHAARLADGEVRLVRAARRGKIVLRLGGEAEVERRDAVLRIRRHRLAERGSSLGVAIRLEVRDAERAQHRLGFRIV